MTNLRAQFLVRNISVEYTNDLASNMAKAALVYKLTNEPENYTNSLQSFYRQNKESNKPSLDFSKEYKERIKNRNDKNMQKQMIELDKALKNLNFTFSFKCEEFKLDGLNNIVNRYKYKRHLFTIKTEPTEVRVFKQGRMSGISGFGITFTTKNSLEMLTQFVFQLNKSISVYTDNPAIMKILNEISVSSFPNNSKILYTSPKIIDRDILEDSDLEENSIKEDKFIGGPKLFKRNYENEDTIEKLSNISPNTKFIKPILKTHSVIEKTPFKSPKPTSRKEESKGSSQPKSKKKLRRRKRSPNILPKNKIQSITIQK